LGHGVDPIGRENDVLESKWRGRARKGVRVKEEPIVFNAVTEMIHRFMPLTLRYYTSPPSSTLYPPEVHEYNEKFTTLLQDIKKRHDPTVTTVAQGVLEWKRKQGGGRIGQSIQEWLDRFYMSRIGIRFLIGQRECGLVEHAADAEG